MREVCGEVAGEHLEKFGEVLVSPGCFQKLKSAALQATGKNCLQRMPSRADAVSLGDHCECPFHGLSTYTLDLLLVDKGEHG